MNRPAAARPGTPPGGTARAPAITGAGVLHPLALGAALWTFALLAVGGVVTGKEAGLSVPDWPLSYGTINPPRWWATPNVNVEHLHRLLGWGIGAILIVLAIVLQRFDRRPWMRRLGWIALAAVVVQGVLGGARVQWLLHYLAAVHGSTGQAFFCLMAALALFTSPGWRAAEEDAAARPALPVVRRRALAALVAVYVQVVVGAVLRHSRAGHDIAHVLPHIVVGLAAAVLGFRAAAAVVLDHPGERRLVVPAILLAGGLLAQVLLGFGAYFANVAGFEEVVRPPYQWITTSAHQAVGALVLVSGLVLWLRARGLYRGAPAAGEGPDAAVAGSAGARP